MAKEEEQKEEEKEEKEYSPVKRPPKYKKEGDSNLMEGGHPYSRIIYDGVFDWDGLYQFIVNWFRNRHYYFEEKDYKYKVPTIFGIEEEFKWNGWRKVTDYYKYDITLEMHTFDVRKIEIVENGEKKTMYKGRFILEFWGKVETDYQGRFQDNPFGLALKKFLDRFIFFKPMDDVWSDRLHYIIEKFEGQIKEYLDMTGKGNAFEDVW